MNPGPTVQFCLWQWIGGETYLEHRMKHRTPLIVILLWINLLLPGVVEGAESLQKIRVGLPSLALTYMPFYVAQEKGLLKKPVSRRNTFR